MGGAARLSAILALLLYACHAQLSTQFRFSGRASGVATPLLSHTLRLGNASILTVDLQVSNTDDAWVAMPFVPSVHAFPPPLLCFPFFCSPHRNKPPGGADDPIHDACTQIWTEQLIVDVSRFVLASECSACVGAAWTYARGDASGEAHAGDVQCGAVVMCIGCGCAV